MEAITDQELYYMMWELTRMRGNFFSLRDRILKDILPRYPRVTVDELSLYLGITRGESLILLRAHRLWHYEVEEEIRLSEKFKPIYETAALGGTFDEIHVGHVALLNAAFRISKEVLIGVTSDEFAARLGKEGCVARFEERVRELESVLEKHGWLPRAKIVEINDPYGPVLSDLSIKALVTGPLVLERAEEAVNLRTSKGLSPIPLEVSPLVLASDGKPVNSTRIRRGEIDRRGVLKGGRGEAGL